MSRRAGHVAAERRGRRAEQLAMLWLCLKGWRIIGRRQRLPMIEVDIIARRGNILAVVEVKQRRTLDDALTALHPDALRRLRRAAENLAASHSAHSRRPISARVDLIALAPGRWPRHIVNVQERETPWR